MKSNIFIEEKKVNISTGVYVAQTNDIQISVIPEFISGNNGLFVWSYNVKISNNSKIATQLMSRYWKIIDGKGIIQEVRGEGVVGEQPTILPNTSFEYSSGVHLNQPSGIMSGQYKMQNIDGKSYDVTIPAFSLDVPSVNKIIN